MVRSRIHVLVVASGRGIGRLCLNAGMTQVGRIGSEHLVDPVGLFRSILTTSLGLIAIPLYAGSFFVWAVVLSRLQLNIAYPMLSMTYAVIPLVSWLVLRETMTAWQWAGILLICAGVLLVLKGGGG